MSEAIPTQEDWLAATAVTTLDLAEMDGLIAKRDAAWEIAEEAKAKYSLAYKEAEKIDNQILQALKDAGKTKYFADGYGTASIDRKPVVRVPSSIEAKKKFFAHLRSLGEDILFSMTTVNSNTLNSWFKAQLEEASSKGILGFSVPGIDDPTTRETLRFTNERKKNVQGSIDSEKI